MNEVRQLKVLTGFRFFAALHVVCFHNFYLFGDAQKSMPALWNAFIQTGESAVSFFFILSGFILTHVYQEKLSTQKQKVTFFVARIAKLYPLYLVGMLLDVPRVIGLFSEGANPLTTLFKAFVSGFVSLFMLQSWIPRITSTWNAPAWSLSCELFFYIVFIFLMKPLVKSKLKALNILIFYVIPLLLFIAFSQIFDSTSAQFRVGWQSIPILRLWEFLIGISLYSLLASGNSVIIWILHNSSLVFWTSLILSIALTTLYRTQIDIKIFSQLVLVPFYSLMILSASNDNIRFQSIFTNRLIYHLGLISYAIYILHQPLKNYLVPILEPSLLMGLTYFISLIVSCSLAHEWIETPLQTRIKNIFDAF